jgi:transposase
MERGSDHTGPITPAQRATVEAMLGDRDLTPRLRERLEMVKGAALGWEVAAIAAWSGRTARTVRRWLAAFRAGGVTALTDAPHPGRPRRADDAYLAVLEWATDTPPRDLGLAFDVWTSARLSAYLTKTTGTVIAPGWLRVVLGRQRFACGRPKHSVAHLQDADEVAACAARLAQAEKKGEAGSAPLRTPL